MNPIRLPIEPNSSLYGSFPSFPTENYGWSYYIPWPINQSIGFNMTIPNFGGIMQWIINIFEWVTGWAGSYSLYFMEYAGDSIANAFIYILGTIMGVIDTLLGTIKYIGEETGIWGIPVEIMIIGVIMLALVYLGFGMAKLASKVVDLL